LPDIVRVKYWEIIADKLSKAGCSWGCTSVVDSNGRTIFVADAHRDGQRFIVGADEMLTAFGEVESAIRLYRRNRHNLRFNDFFFSRKK
jgi:hypothetical protein